MLIQHVKGYPYPSMYSKNKGGITFDTDRETPCSCEGPCGGGACSATVSDGGASLKINQCDDLASSAMPAIVS